MGLWMIGIGFLDLAEQRFHYGPGFVTSVGPLRLRSGTVEQVLKPAFERVGVCKSGPITGGGPACPAASKPCFPPNRHYTPNTPWQQTLKRAWDQTRDAP